MSLPVTAAFIAAANADANQPVAQVQLMLGNYASAAAYGATVASSGDDGSGNYPAAGAIDGDRTEINVGAASGADNDIGKSSWRSSGVPGNGDTVTLDIIFSQARDINYLKLYHLSSHGLSSYKISQWNGSAWVVFAATSDVVSAGQTSITTTGKLDVVSFPDITTTKIRLQVLNTAVAMDHANVVEIEVYRLVDITARISGVQVQRQRDYKLGNPLATKVTITGINNDRFFSFSHVPTAAELSAGFINTELRPGIGILVSYGFNAPGGGTQIVSSFVGTIDRIQVRPKNRDVVIEGRDGMKGLINSLDSCKLKTSQDIGANITYVLNRGNVSSYEMSVNTTGINIDYFFTQAQDRLSTIRDLVQAAGDSLFFFDENGIATFKFFTAATTIQHIYTSESDWEAGTLVAIDTTTVPGQMSYLYDTAQTWNNATTGWTSIVSNGSPTFNSDGTGIYLSEAGGITAQSIGIYRAQSLTVGDWSTQFQEDAGNAGSFSYAFAIGLMAGSVASFSGTPTISTIFLNGYVLQIIIQGATMAAGVNRSDGSGNLSGAFTGLTYVARNPGSTHTIRVRRSQTGQFTVFLDNVNVGGGQDTTTTTTSYFGYEITKNPAFSGDVACTVHFLNGTLSTPETVDGIGSWTSPSLDMGATVIALGALTASQTLNAGTIAYYTSTSADNVTYDAFVAVSGNGQINSIVRRYMKTKAVMTLASIGDSPVILDITVNWVVGAGSPKYPPAPASATFSFDSTMMDVQQEVADNLGGDSAIINDVIVQAQPFVLAGADADVQFQGTVGTPPTPISASTPLSVSNGTVITIAPVINSGMDTSRMSGANPAAAAITFAAGASGSWVFSSIHPTLPVLKITITGTGTITNLQIQGKHFSSASYLLAQQATDAASIAAYGDRQLSISNQWITGTSLAASIASTLVANSKAPTSYIPSCLVRPMWHIQIGDRVTAADVNLDLSADYIVVGKTDKLMASEKGGDAGTGMVLLKVPAGS